METSRNAMHMNNPKKMMRSDVILFAEVKPSFSFEKNNVRKGAGDCACLPCAAAGFGRLSRKCNC
jgi:hypothetical protein